MYQVYILYSEKHDKYYIGQTQDLGARIERHNRGQVPFTKKYIPWQLLINLEKGSRSEAILLERKLKNLSKIRLEKFIEKYSGQGF